MEDNNIVKVKKYVPGYDSDTRQQIEPGYIRTQTVVDRDSEDFKYGLEYWEGSSLDKNRYINPLYLFQDPLFPIFDIVLDSEYSPLLSTDKNSLYSFLQDYGDIFSIGTRKRIYEEFKKTLFTLFNKDFKDVDIRNKSYYINSINGLDKLTARIVDFEKDKITININEDVSMIAAYLSHLYNNLSYSYRDQRQMVPANLLRFNMFIKIHDVRNMPFYLPSDKQDGTTTSFDKSYQIYLLRDCTFDFKKSKNFDDSVTVAGFEAGLMSKASSISMDIVYKSVEIESEYPLIRDSFYFSTDNNKALRLNNKYGSIYLSDRDLSHNSNYITQSKSVDEFYNEVDNGGDLNNNNISSQEGFDSQGADRRAKDNYKFGQVSSNKNNDTRKSITSDIDKKYEGEMYPDFYKDRAFNLTDTAGNDGYVYTPDVINERGVDPRWKNASQSDTTFEIQKEYRTTRIDPINAGRPYDPSVYNKQWNFQSDYPSPQTGPSLEAWRDSILGQINIGSFLMNLPFNIIQMFMGGFHGMQTSYIMGYGPEVVYGHRGGDNFTEEYSPPVLNGEIIPDSIIEPGGVYNHENDLEGEIIPIDISKQDKLEGDTISTEYEQQESLNGETISIDLNQQGSLDGEYIISRVPAPISLDGEKISFKINQPESLNGERLISRLRPPISLNGEFIPSNIVPKIPLSGHINTSFSPRDPLSGVIDTSFQIQPELEGTIDTSFSIQPELEGSIDTSFRLKSFDSIYLYNNNYEQREIDLGLLYLNVNKENILPITYLYSKVEKFHNLSNYYVYNKVKSEIKTPNDIIVDQTLKETLPFNLIYKYNNNIDVIKTLDNIRMYNNNANRYNNMTVLNVINEIPEKDKFIKIDLYNNTTSNKELKRTYLYEKKTNDNLLTEKYLYDNEDIIIKSLNGDTISMDNNKIQNVINLGNILSEETTEKRRIEMGSLYEPSDIKKLLEPIKLFEPSKRKIIDLGMIYEKDNVIDKKLIEKNNFEIIEKENIEKIHIDRDFIEKETIPEIYINDISKEREVEKLNNNINLESDDKKEKQGLNNERLR